MKRIQACIIIGLMYRLRHKLDPQWSSKIQRDYTQWLYDNWESP